MDDSVPMSIEAVREAQRVVAEDIEPGPRNAVATVDRLIAVLDGEELVTALRGQSS